MVLPWRGVTSGLRIVGHTHVKIFGYGLQPWCKTLVAPERGLEPSAYEVSGEIILMPLPSL